LQLSDFLAAAGVTGLALAGGLAGIYCSKRPYWGAVFGVSFFIFLVILAINRIPPLHYQLPFSWLAKGRFEFFAFAVSLPLMFGTLIPRLHRSRQRRMLWVLAVVGTGYFGVMPFAEAALVRERLEGLETWREDGICLQTTDFTCGAAAAVTALHRLGLRAEESELAIAAHTTPSWGASSGQLAGAIELLYGRDGVRCEIKRFSSIQQMGDVCPVIATVKYRFMVDHYVTVLSVDDDELLVADPLKGLEWVPCDAFNAKWRRIGISVLRE
jgi:predicted double-glycine peptidase